MKKIIIAILLTIILSAYPSIFIANAITTEEQEDQANEKFFEDAVDENADSLENNETADALGEATGYDGMTDLSQDPEESSSNPTSMPSIPKSDLLPGPSGTDQSSVQSYFREKALPSFISGFIGIVGVAAFISLLISGIQFLTAYGNDEKIGAAKKTATYAIIGFVIAILSYAIVSIISSLPISQDEDETASLFSIPTAYAAETEEDPCADPSKLSAKDKLDCLMPTEYKLIEASPNSQGASLPSGDLIEQTIPKVVTLILYAVSLAVLASVVYSGILLVVARGNEEEIKKAQNMLLYSAIGVIVIGIAYAFVYGLSQLNI